MWLVVLLRHGGCQADRLAVLAAVEQDGTAASQCHSTLEGSLGLASCRRAPGKVGDPYTHVHETYYAFCTNTKNPGSMFSPARTLKSETIHRTIRSSASWCKTHNRFENNRSDLPSLPQPGL